MPIAEKIDPEGVESAAIVVGIPSYNEAATIASVARTVDRGLREDFPDLDAVIVNADNDSEDATRENFLEAETETPKIYVSTGEGVRGKGNNLLNLFEITRELDAGAMITVDSDLQSIEPAWVKKLCNPIFKGFDLVTPIYERHKYDGTITNNFAYPLISAVFGHRIRQPIGGEYGLSRKMVDHLAEQPVDPAVRNFGIDIWLSSHGCISGHRVCQAFMDAPKIHGAKDPGVHLDRMFGDVVGTLFELMAGRASCWAEVTETRPSIMFGFGLGCSIEPEPIPVDMGRLHRQFVEHVQGHDDELEAILGEAQHQHLDSYLDGNPFELEIPRDAWARIVYDFAVAYAAETLPRGRVLELLLPLYKGEVLSDILYLAERESWFAERHVEQTVDDFEHQKPYLLERWREVVGGL